MIARYTRPEMAKIWSDSSRYLKWLEVERAVCEEWASQGLIPKRDWATLKPKLAKLIRSGGVSPKRVDALEAITRHDVIAFTTAVAEKIGATSRFVHFGLTSSDVVDTALSLMTLEALDLIERDLRALLGVLRRMALVYKDVATIGRSHGIFAEPTSFGLKFLGWHAEWSRHLARLKQVREEMSYGKLSGAVGVSSHIAPRVEQSILKRLGLKRETVSTQVLPRDRHAQVLHLFALCGSTLERMAIELRHLQRSEVGEVIEGFKKGQKGSSAMPHKRNPISSENLTGCARLLRGYALPALENIALWHERDISHSSVERVALPDSATLLDYALVRMTGVLLGLSVQLPRVAANLESAGSTSYSGHFLLALVQAGVKREQAYAWIQKAALLSLDTKVSFLEALSQQPRVRKILGDQRLVELASLKYQLRHVDEIYRLALG